MATKANTASKPAAAKPATKPAAAKPATVQVRAYKLTGAQPPKPYRQNSARGLWWAHVAATLAGGKPQPAATLYALAASNPPSTPKTGRYAGQCEPPAGWYSYFVRQGCVQVCTMQVPAQG